MVERYRAFNEFLELTGNNPTEASVHYFQLALHSIYKNQMQKYYNEPEDHIILSSN